ncbi:MAG: hypothetical protein E6Q88_07135 [Lysobacteraceae bacterium]|nr:MAG: hypothetical protein E6Q88_07135 [Xanthomonadaceae bacterium]
MRRFVLMSALLACLAPAWAGDAPKQTPHLLDRFKSLAGDWSGEGLDGNSMPNTRVSYTVTAGGNAVEELLFGGTNHEMRTLYVRDGDDVVLVHFCASGNHPKMRARQLKDGRVEFSFDGGVNFDATKAGHMHDATFTFMGADELRTSWRFWEGGKPAEHVANLHLKRIGAAAATPAPSTNDNTLSNEPAQ